ncbi:MULTISPECIES: Tex family protein [unclassified Paracoccus (in: a-proteobacteria)]|uniref:Tex family protein n=1 Tax=unclassified Paracoccus (in: a-proteobacteria) TaxID=2688777 RepID=UPI0021E10202|nr:MULTISPECIES: Tex family protein [unclassified Paracoccus (in: a-proteobacteria)]UXU74864.1 RNA-binding transcriptional accessory protein [Paracoccus sp. SMMA_5]UXU80765.1 RNA-binding transcriptional accessory protein [Paracoccus sp. SMMA_5_TC]
MPDLNAADRIFRTIAVEINASPAQVAAATGLLDGGATVPFIARYRKEVTGGLDDTQLRSLAERLSYLRELEARRAVITESIRSQGKLTDDLARAIHAADSKAALEDIYLPYKPKRRTKAMIARENGLEPLLRAIQADRRAAPEDLATAYVSDAVPDAKGALDGARDILVEELSENADLLGRLRAYMQAEAVIAAKVVAGKEQAGAKFSDYFDHAEKWASIPAHRALAILRGAREEVLTIDIAPPAEGGAARAEAIICAALAPLGEHPGDQWLRKVAAWCWRVRLSNTMYVDLLTELRSRAHAEAIRVFARNLKDLLLASPAGPRPTIGLDPGIRTGVKLAAVDATGKLVQTATLYPFPPKSELREAEAQLAAVIVRHGIELVAIGNGTASRETERFVAEVLRKLPAGVKAPVKVIVSEAGASVYSASELAAREFPDLDVSLRGAVSIARRLQDPLAELVKVPPESIGVGQYQHDVDQRQLARTLEAVVEDAVNAVGVDVNTASAPLLAHVAGLGPALAQAIVAHRDAAGAFRSRAALKKVAGLGPRAFEQCAGFLRIRDGDEPLDASAVHPEAYGLARRIVAACGRDIRQIMGQPEALRGIRAQDFVDADFGLPTVRDILAELEKPGRDPRPSFVTASFADGVEQIGDLRPGMLLEGTVTNVAAFGAFVDIGVHQDGLVHISQLADRFVKDPNEVVKVGDVVKVRVTEVDVARKRIGLTMRKDGGGQNGGNRDGGGSTRDSRDARAAKPPASKGAGRVQDQPGALGAALMNALRKG